MSHVLTATYLRDIQSVTETSEANQRCALGIDFAGYLSEGEIIARVFPGCHCQVQGLSSGQRARKWQGPRADPSLRGHGTHCPRH